MATMQVFNDPTVPTNPIYWVDAFGVGISFQDAVAGPGVTINWAFKESGASPRGEAANVLTPAEKANIQDAMAKISLYANVTFAETTEASADLVFARGDVAMNGSTGTTFIGAPPVQAWAYGTANNTANNTYIYKHELLHALGLDHSTAVFGNNTNPIPADQSTGTTLYGSWQPGWQVDYQLFDIAALQYLYGPPTNQRAGNDTYTLNPGAFNPLSPQLQWPLLWDGGGFDTLDYSALGVALDISLEPGVLNRIGGAAGAILSAGVFSINYRTVIEALLGGSAGDNLSGNSAANVLNGNGGNDVLRGGAGADQMTGGANDDRFVYRAGDGADAVTDFFAGGTDDRIDLTAFITINTLTQVLTRTTQVGANAVINLGGGDTLTLQNVNKASLSVNDVVGIVRGGVGNDFNGDVRGDVLWRHTDGTVVRWLLDGAGSFAGAVLSAPEPGWKLEETGDFNRDGTGDILWRHANGTIITWLMNTSGGVAATQSLGTRDATWKVAESGDFNRDGRSDILWRHDSGAVETWLLNEVSGTLVQPLAGPDNSWKIQASGDFNGDGRDDILWRNNNNGDVVTWLMNEVSSFVGIAIGNPGAGFQVEAAADFNADGRDDILWRHADGSAAVWLLNGSGGFTAAFLASPDSSWQIQDAFDANADGRADVLWRHTGGTVSTWLIDAALSFSASTLAGPEAAWQVQNDPTGIV